MIQLGRTTTPDYNSYETVSQPRSAERAAEARAHPATSAAETRWLYVGLCLFLGTQVFQIPIATVGPWPFWPRLADIGFVFLVVAWLFTPSRISSQKFVLTRFVRLTWLLIIGSLFSYLCFTLLLNQRAVALPAEVPSVGFGAYGVVRLAQFALLAHVVSTLPLDAPRLERIRKLLVWVLVISVAVCFLTFAKIWNPADIAPWIPNDRSIGAWWSYVRKTGQGIGAIGYNHAYVAAQIMLLVALILQLTPKQTTWPVAALGIAGAGVFISGSRSGWLSFLIFAIAILWGIAANRGSLNIFVLGIGTAAIAWLLASVFGLGSGLRDLVDRQISAFEITDVDNLSGRASIWSTTINALLDGNPVSILFGHGISSTIDLGAPAHSLPLTYLYEFGIVGTTLVILYFLSLLMNLRRCSVPFPGMYWLTIALLAGSFSQETFYPATASGHFLGFYLVAVVLSLKVCDPLSDASRAQGVNIAADGRKQASCPGRL